MPERAVAAVAVLVEAVCPIRVLVPPRVPEIERGARAVLELASATYNSEPGSIVTLPAVRLKVPLRLGMPSVLPRRFCRRDGMALPDPRFLCFFSKLRVRFRRDLVSFSVAGGDAEGGTEEGVMEESSGVEAVEGRVRARSGRQVGQGVFSEDVEAGDVERG